MLTTAEVHRLINQIIDPCSAARGVPIGLVDMGLLEDVTIVLEPDGRCGVEVTMCVTGPSCLMSMEFEARVQYLLKEAGAAWVKVRWDSDFLWTQERMDSRARRQLAERRAQLRAEARSGAGHH